jgi:hypothetical protein
MIPWCLIGSLKKFMQNNNDLLQNC